MAIGGRRGALWLPAYDFGPGRTVRQVGVGSYPCVVLDDDELKCWTWRGPKGEPALDVGD